MVLIKRLGDSLFSPKDVLQYRVDKKIVTFLYFLLLSILLMVPNFISFFSDTSFFTYEVKTNIRYDVFNQEEVPYEIVNGKLTFTGTNEKSQYVINLSTYEVTLIFTTQDSIVQDDKMYSNIIVFSKEKVELKNRLNKMELGRYSDYASSEGLDLKYLTTSDRLFWEQTFDLLNEFEKGYHSLYVTAIVLFIIFRSIGTLFLFILFITFINRISAENIYSFGDHLKLMIYYSTPFVFGVIFATLFDFVLIEYIGLIITFIYSLRINHIEITGGKDNEL